MSEQQETEDQATKCRFGQHVKPEERHVVEVGYGRVWCCRACGRLITERGR